MQLISHSLGMFLVTNYWQKEEIPRQLSMLGNTFSNSAPFRFSCKPFSLLALFDCCSVPSPFWTDFSVFEAAFMSTGI